MKIAWGILSTSALFMTLVTVPSWAQVAPPKGAFTRSQADASKVELRQIETLIKQGVEAERTGKRQLALANYKRALVLAREIKAHQFETAALVSICSVHIAMSNYQEAAEILQQALIISRSAGSLAYEARALNMLGQLNKHSGHNALALNYYRQALSIEQHEGLTNDAVNTINKMALLLDEAGNRAQAVEHFSQAIALLRSLPVTTEAKENEAVLLSNIGSIYIGLHDYDRAEKYYRQAMKISRSIGYADGESKALHNLGFIYDEVGNIKRATAYYQNALRMRRAIMDRRGEAITLNQLALIYYRNGDTIRALQFLRDTASLLDRIGESKEATRVRADIAKILSETQEGRQR
jgi:tetratricopeptide (TPR) repeat protein